MRIRPAVALVLVSLVAPALAADAGDVAAVKAVIERMTVAGDTKDLSGFTSAIAPDPDSVFFGTDAAEYWIGAAAMKPAVERQFKALESQRSSVRDLRVKLLAGGKAAVATYFLDAEGKSMGEAFAVKGARVTAVLEKRKGRWMVVSSHASVPVSGQAVKY